MKHQLKTIVPLSLALFVLVSYQFIAASSVWSPAPGTPPNPNADMPIHTGGDQIKSGGLSLNTLATTYGASVGGNLSVGGTANVGNNINVSNNAYVGGLWSGNWVGGNYIRANNQVRSNTYCDYGGGNCFSPSSVGASSMPSCPAGSALISNGGTSYKCANIADYVGSIVYVNSLYRSSSVSCNPGDVAMGAAWCGSYTDGGDCQRFYIACLAR